MVSSGMMYIPSLIQIDSDIQKVLGGDTYADTQAARWSYRPTFIYLQ
jgi:hypothetical protein